MNKKKRLIGVTLFGIILIVVFWNILAGYGQEQQTEFTYQDKKGVAFAEENARKAIEKGDIYIISGGEGNEPVVNEKDLDIIKGIPMKSIGCLGDFEYAKKFNKTIIDYLRKKEIQAQKSLSKDDILRIAINKAKELGYNPREMDIIYDEENKKLKEHLSHSGVFVYDERIKEWKSESGTSPEKEYPLLTDRNYQAVYFSPKQMILGRDLWIFIDKITGGMITYVRGK